MKRINQADNEAEAVDELVLTIFVQCLSGLGTSPRFPMAALR